MTKQIAALAVVVMVVAGLTVAAQTDVTGTWNFAVNLSAGSGEPVFVVTQDGDTLSGTYEGTFGDAELIGKVTGDMIEFTFGAEGVGEATYTGKITRDMMEGTCDYGDVGSGTWSAKTAG